MAVSVAVTNAHRRYRIRHKTTTRYVRRVLSKEGRTIAEISVIFIDGPTMREMNRKFLAHDYATDVISFPLSSDGRPDGEIYINADRAREQAARYEVPFGEEIARLVIHGTLHLAGYDDKGKRRARIMKKAEDAHVKYWFDKNRKGRG